MGEEFLCAGLPTAPLLLSVLTQASAHKFSGRKPHLAAKFRGFKTGYRCQGQDRPSNRGPPSTGDENLGDPPTQNLKREHGYQKARVLARSLRASGWARGGACAIALSGLTAS